MEIQKKMVNKCPLSAPVKPLQGYFRFRQEMMQLLPSDERTSQNIVRLWNMLTPEEKALRQQQTQLEMHQYLTQLSLWTTSQQIPLQPLHNITNFNQPQPNPVLQLKHLDPAPTLCEQQQQEIHPRKAKAIRKATQRKPSKKVKPTNQN